MLIPDGGSPACDVSVRACSKRVLNYYVHTLMPRLSGNEIMMATFCGFDDFVDKYVLVILNGKWVKKVRCDSRMFR